jgi:hypothetical protein
MPNYCENDLYVSGPDKDVRNFLADAHRTVIDKNDDIFTPEHKRGIPTEREVLFDFNAFVPMPEDLNIEASSEGDLGYAALTGKVYGKYSLGLSFYLDRYQVRDRQALLGYLQKNNPKALELGEKFRRNIERYGAPHWYEWCIPNWGTKWNAGDVVIGDVHVGPRSSRVKIKFQTAWSPPLPVIYAASNKHPYVRLRLECFEMGAQYRGIYTCKGGLVLKDEQYKYQGRRGG